ncbi:hypothetical protein L873DRAFT_1796051 [Choiromyces venosus 120613-1]|uniref:Uncharacterized protein n=1 Tax=Choiromyces venosus 120613-1 TaxID=1336337 RepID=A0A3N4IU89_9PEZI|nr:hypothetical protein L873DRAFT_1796051 [Choiromyces venosus 120613-1]
MYSRPPRVSTYKKKKTIVMSNRWTHGSGPRKGKPSPRIETSWLNVRYQPDLTSLVVNDHRSEPNNPFYSWFHMTGIFGSDSAAIHIDDLTCIYIESFIVKSQAVATQSFEYRILVCSGPVTPSASTFATAVDGDGYSHMSLRGDSSVGSTDNSTRTLYRLDPHAPF